jgi:hypothetical protein
MKATELRIGNYHLYHIVDKFNDPQEWDDICQIDAQDLVYLSTPKGEADSDYKPIPITEEWLKKFGFCYDDMEDTNEENTWYHLEAHGFKFSSDKSVHFNRVYVRLNKISLEIKYVHHLQNLYFSLTGKELKIKL